MPWGAALAAALRVNFIGRITPRQLAVYASTLLLVLFADPRPATFAAGCALALLGCALRIWAFGHLDKNKVMVTTGPYAHTRNPAYLGSFLALCGVGLAAGNAGTSRGQVVWSFFLVLVAAFFAVYLPRKYRREYRRLHEHFGDRATQHAANVPDFWPRFSPWRSGDSRRFSLRRVSANREWPWSLVLALLLAAIWFADRWSPLQPVLGLR